ncbi:DEAD/DEAH box helicase family protein [Planococcus ruber]|uniref:DEAD/DEAH box helicase family protein n=1 Tax=Planococcus ruber TaxID=2027871 RepID=UPI001FEF23A0|nr:DEAD/DEAH box helicase family protein [Planococcus ruber]MCJ1909968.1 DEAD/DEAH box helicase family protein [Planococcus ruber]
MDIKEQNQLKFVNYMHSKLKDNLLGSSIEYLTGVKPLTQIYGGVVFPNSIFRDIDDKLDENDMDPDIKFTSISKNINFGLEFLVNTNQEFKAISLDGSFSVFVRIIPSFEDVQESLEYLNSDTLDEKSNTNSKGLTLVEKYKKFTFNFTNLKIIKTENSLTFDNASLQKIQEDFNLFLNGLKQDKELLNPKNEYFNKVGGIDLPKIFSNAQEYKDFINQITSEELIVPNFNFELNTNSLEYIKFPYCTKLLITLTNTTSSTIENKTFHPLELYDCSLKVQVPQSLHVPFEFDGVRKNYLLDNAYMAKGQNCTATTNIESNSIIISSEFIPDFFQKLYRTREDLTVKFEDLLTPIETLKKLNETLNKMQRYAFEWQLFIQNKGDLDFTLETEEDIKQCGVLLKEFEAEIHSFELGIYSLSKDSKLLKAFNFMNKVFIDSSKGKYEGWRLFQIIFIVRMFPSFYCREMSDSETRKNEIIASTQFADVLWFPTGGGKTEAYLGAILTALFYDRLRGKLRGVTSWLRFPLRMLSKNQLDRLAKILIIAERYRRSSSELNNLGVPFSLGFFAGSGNTDNAVSKKTKNEAMKNNTSKMNKMLIHKCPNCNSDIEFSFNENSWRYVHKCINEKCFVVTELDGQIPLYITDSEVYRFIPSVICGTVDKTAISGRNREFSQLFGQVQGRCQNHGYFSDTCIVGAYDEWQSCTNKAVYRESEIAKVKADFYDPIPSLFIQDELHLLKDELGSLSSHNEGYLNELAITYGKQKYFLPKIIAATATIESYEKHIKHLYLRKPRKYPSMGYKPGESFYATSKPEKPRRLYIGILPHSKNIDEVISRAVYIYQNEIINMYNDPHKYISEIGLINISDFHEFIGLYDLSTIYVNTKTMGSDINRRLGENYDIPLSLEFLTGEDNMDKIVKVLDRIETEKKGDSVNKLNVLSATSLISHGVDLDRINNFFMAGMPSKQAEYIQASSRSARSNIGLVFVCFKSTNLKERSQYQFFKENHKFLDQLVDPVPINRMAIKAIEKSLSSILSSLLLGIHSYMNKKPLDTCGKVDDYVLKRASEGIDVYEQLLEQILNIYGCNSDFFPIATKEKTKKIVSKLLEEKLDFLRSQPRNAKLKSKEILNPMNSFREIEEGLPIRSGRNTSLVLHLNNYSSKYGGDI